MEYSKNTVAEYLPEFIEALKKQLDLFFQVSPHLFSSSPIEGQERTRATFNNYFDMFENAGTPVPWLKVAGNALICWIRECERDNYLEMVADDIERRNSDIEDGGQGCIVHD